jgi:peroxiredoxin
VRFRSWAGHEMPVVLPAIAGRVGGTVDIAWLVVAGRLVLAGVFLVSGVAKLADLRGSREAARAFGVPAALAGVVGTALPLAELAVAAMLLPANSARWGALGSLVVLIIFALAIVIALVRGRRPQCNCFGQLHSAPVGWKTLARNLLLAATAGFLLLAGTVSSPSLLAWMGGLTIGEAISLGLAAISLAAAAILGWLLLNLVRQQGRILLRLDHIEGDERRAADAPPAANRSQPVPAVKTNQPAAGLPVGDLAPEFRLADVYGDMVTLSDLRENAKPVMLLFTDPGCGPCASLLPQVADWQQEYASELTIALISRGTVAANRAEADQHQLVRVLLDDGHEVAASYRCLATPSAVVVDTRGAIAAPSAAGADAVQSLLTRTLSARGGAIPAELNLVPAASKDRHGHDPGSHQNGDVSHHRAMVGLSIGTPAPGFALPDSSGRTTALIHFRGHNTLVLFWNPGCGFCRQLLPELKAWEAKPPPTAPRLVLVSTGDAAAAAQMGLASPVLLDPAMDVMTRFAVSGTPIAVLVGPEGQIQSDPAIGGPGVIDQLYARPGASRAGENRMPAPSSS